MMRNMRRRSFPTSDPDREIPSGPVDWKRLLAYLRPYWKHMLVALLATVGSGALSLVFPWVIQNVIDSVLTQRNFELLNQITAGLIFVFILRSLTSLIETYLLNYVGERLVVDVRTQLYRHLQHLSLGFFVQRGVGELASRMSNDVGAIRSTLTNSVNTFIQQIVIMIGSVVVMLAILKTGCAYVPLDPEYPAARLQFMLAELWRDVMSAQLLVRCAAAARDRGEPVGQAVLQSRVRSEWTHAAGARSDRPRGVRQPARIAMSLPTYHVAAAGLLG